MVIAMDKCTSRVRVRDARGDDIKATIIKEKEKGKEREKEKEKEKENTCLLHMEIFPCQNPI